MNQAKRILGAVMACQLLGLSINATAAVAVHSPAL